MVSRNSRCDTNRLREFLDSPPNEENGACDVAEHLEHCEKCRKELEALAGGRWWNEVRPLVRPDVDDDPAIRTQAAEAVRGDDPELNFLSRTELPGYIGQFGPYPVLGVLGKGGMGVVLKALDPALRRIVAIKVLSPMLSTSGPARARFTREAQAAAAVVHQHVVAIFHIDTDKDSGVPYLVMPCIVGRSLQERIDRDGPLDMAAVLRIGMQAASGLAAAHAQGIVHRDIKPANILLENGVERVVLTDFGLARTVDDASLTRSGVIAGTPQYMSPEQARGDVADHRSDLFSLGSVLYAMCTGHPPFRASSVLAVLRRVSDEQPRPIREVNPAVSEALAGVIEKLHAKDPAERYQSAGEVAAELERLLAESQKPVRRSAAERVPAPASKSLPRRPRNPAVAAAVAIVLLAGLFVITSGGKDGLRNRLAMFSLDPNANVPSVQTDADSDGPQTGDPPVHDRRHLSLAVGRHSEGKNAVARVLAAAQCDDCDDSDPTDDDDNLPLPKFKLPRLPIALPLGPLVRFETDTNSAVQLVFGSPAETINGSGKVETRSFPLQDFTTVDVRGPFHVELKQGNEFKVSVTADDNLFEHLRVEKEDNALVVAFRGQNLCLNLDRDHRIKAEITLPNLASLKLNGATQATTGDFKTSGPFRLQINGASQFKGAIHGDGMSVEAGGASLVKLAGAGKDLKLRANGASHLKMSDFAASGERLIVDATGSSSVALKGKVTAGAIKAIGASHIDLRGTSLAAADITVEGASHATVSVSEKLDYSVTDVSHLDYYGNPTIGRANKNGVSHVTKKK